MSVVVALLVGAVGGGLWWAAAQDSFGAPALTRTNHRGVTVPTAAGMVVPFVLSGGAAGTILFDVGGTDVSGWAALTVPSLLAGTGFGLLGLFDDVAGVGESGGFRAHLRGLAAGRLGSGAAKVVGGAALGVVVAGFVQLDADPAPAVLALLRDGAVVALAANVVNLFDRRPGRSIKLAVVTMVVVGLVSRSAQLAMPALGVGGALGLLVADLRERCMIGDTGSNALGSLCGLALLVAAPSGTARWVVLGVLLVLNLTSEFVSFSRVIESVAPLRWFDRLGVVHDA